MKYPHYVAVLTSFFLLLFLIQPGGLAHPYQHGCSGVDGDIVRSASAQEAVFVQATNYTVEEGVEMSLPSVSGAITICATYSITILGTLSASGAGNPGGNPGSNGISGIGGGGQSGNAGGAGGAQISSSNAAELIIGPRPEVGAGGGGGDGSTCSVAAVGRGGGGGGSTKPGGTASIGGSLSGIGGTHGAGGRGGGILVLVSPNITLGPASKLLANGSAGTNASGTNCAGGGGGSGGLIVVISPNYTDSATAQIWASGGNGGNGGGGSGAAPGGVGGLAAERGGNSTSPAVGGSGGGGGAGGVIIHDHTPWEPESSGGGATEGNFTGNFTGNVTFLGASGMIETAFDPTSPFYGDITVAGVVVMLLWLVAFLWTANRQYYLCAVFAWLGILQPFYVSGFGATFRTILSAWVLFLLVYVIIDWRDASRERKAKTRGIVMTK